MSPILVYFVLKKELLNFSETASRPLDLGSKALTTQPLSALYLDIIAMVLLRAMNKVKFTVVGTEEVTISAEHERGRQ